jgi:hypothetical protein
LKRLKYERPRSFFVRTTSRSGVGRIAAAVAVVVIVAVAGGVGIVISSKGSHSTSSQTTSSAPPSNVVTLSTTSSSTVTGCVFSPPPPPMVSNSSVAYYSGCLTPGTSGTYLLGVTDPNGVVINDSVIRTQYPAQITIAGAQVANLTDQGNGGIVSTANDTTLLSLPDVLLFANSGYGFTVVNQSGENNIVIINLSMIDEAVYSCDNVYQCG